MKLFTISLRVFLSAVIPLCVSDAAYPEDIPAAPFPTLVYDSPHEQLPPVAGRLFSKIAIGYLTGGKQPWLVLTTNGHGAGTSFYPLHLHDRFQWIAGSAQFSDFIDGVQTATDWDGDGADDLVRAENGKLIVYLMTPGTSTPQVREAIPLNDANGRLYTIRTEHLSVVESFGRPALLVSLFRTFGYYPDPGEQGDPGISLGGGYDAWGMWRGDLGMGFAAVCRSLGDSNEAGLDSPQLLFSGRGYAGTVLGAYITGWDWTNDGLYDLCVADFNGQLWFFRQKDAPDRRSFELPVPLRNPMGESLALPQCMARCQTFDWNGDGTRDLVAGTEDSFVYVMLYAGSDTLGTPLFDDPTLIRGSDPEIDVGVLTVQNFVDWDEDGDRDIVLGNAAGQLVWVENTGTDNDPCYRFFQPLLCDGKPFRVMASVTGSIQGPNEATWGYTCPSAVDWDRDGHPDIVMGDVTGYTTVYLSDGKIGLQAGKRLTLGGKPYRTVWRVRPIPVDWDEDGALELVYLDPRGRLGMHERGAEQFDLQTFQSFYFDNGQEVDLDGTGGMEGRCKLCVVDWDGDGDLDVLTGTKGSTPWAAETGKGSKVLWLERLPDRNNRTVFAYPKTLGTDAGPFPLGDHTICPEPYFYSADSIGRHTNSDTATINPAIQYLSLSSEDGRIYRIDRQAIRVVHQSMPDAQ